MMKRCTACRILLHWMRSISVHKGKESKTNAMELTDYGLRLGDLDKEHGVRHFPVSL